MHRLQQFVIGVLLPSLSRLTEHSESQGNTWIAQTRAEIIEACLWLHLGVEVGAFPERPSQSIYEAYLVPFFGTLLSSDEDLRMEMRRGRLYLAHSRESIALTLALPRYARILVERGMRGEHILGTELSGFRDPISLKGIFQALSVLYSSFIQNPAARWFTHGINFVDANSWEKSWYKDCDADEVREADISGSGSPVALTLAGYLNFWGYGARWKEVFEYFEGSKGASFSELFRLRERMSELLSWRINLRSRETANRFEKVQNTITEAIEREALTHKMDPGLFRQSIEASFELWGVRVPVPA